MCRSRVGVSWPPDMEQPLRSTAHALPNTPPDPFSPGSAELDVSHIRERAESTQYFLPDSAHPGSKIAEFRHNTEHLVDDQRGPAVLVTTSMRGYADSAIILRSGLRPIREIQNYFARHRRLVYEYDGNRVHVRDSTADSTVRVSDHTYDGDVFHFNELGLVMRSLPLRAGYEAILPLYSEGDDALEMDTVKVVGKNDQGTWVVRFADRVVVTQSTIDENTRRITSTKGERRAAPNP
jgi:hypothetical protein